jgi:hypothetical protein
MSLKKGIQDTGDDKHGQAPTPIYPDSTPRRMVVRRFVKSGWSTFRGSGFMLGVTNSALGGAKAPKYGLGLYAAINGRSLTTANDP